ncbi:MAG: NUDIX hydrolase [Fidelibacterota bacterium]|nr:MAG: NUDIX hydrolase [Candidatus Neomarinimicrobiota bacterium]
MNLEHLAEKKISSEPVFQGRLLDVHRDEVQLPNGTTTVREYIRHPGAAVMVPLLENGNLVFLHQFRYALGAVMVELPAGKLDPGEDPLDTARRELAEETGYNCDRLVRLGLIHPCIGYSDERIGVYLATGLKPAKAEGESDESLEPFELSLEEALAWIEQGRITDVKTIIALYWAERYLAGEWGS